MNNKIYKTYKLTCALAVVTAAGLFVGHGPVASAATIFGLTTDNGIVVFDSAMPALSTAGGAVTGLATNETLVALDYQPATGNVLLLGNLSNVYRLNDTSGSSFTVTQIGSTLDPALVGTSFAFDFNPAFMSGEFARIITDTDDNRVISGTTGGYLSPVEKTDVFYAPGDPNEGIDPNIAGIAYTNSVAGATSTQQYGIDASLGVLTTVANNDGTLQTIGSLGIAGPLTNELGFDIFGELGVAFASIQSGPNSLLYTVDLGTGAANLVGPIGSGDLIRDITAVPGVKAVPDGGTSVALCALSLVGLIGMRKRLAEE